jgi:hypothetical protein
VHPTCSIEVMDVTGSVTDTILHICTLYKKKYAVRIRDAKKVRYLLALQSARAAACLAHPVVAAGRLLSPALGGLVRGEKEDK